MKIGEPFTPSDDKAESIRILRDRMATQVYELFEKQPVCERSSLPDDYWERELQNRCRGYKRARTDPQGFIRYEARAVYRSKGLTAPDEAFEHLSRLQPDRNNAFLFNKRLYGCPCGTDGQTTAEDSGLNNKPMN